MQPLMTNRPAILIVEDEPLIAMMLEDFLDLLDYRVGGVADGVQGALDLLRAGPFDAAILDVNLRGGEKSWPIADALAEAGIPFAFATGDSGDDLTENYRNRPTLPKPFTIDCVKKVLEGLA